MIGLSSSYFAFRGKGIRQSAEEAFSLGFDTLEFGAAHAFEENALETLKQIASEFPDKNFTVHGLFPPKKERLWFNPGLGLTGQNREILDSAFEAAALVEAQCLGVHPGYACKVGFDKQVKRGMHYPKPVELIPKEKALENVLAVVGYAMQKSQETGIKFAIENICEPRTPLVVEEKEDFEAVFRQFPKLGLLLDLGHAMFKGNLPEMLELSHKILEVHVHSSLHQRTGISEDTHSVVAAQHLEPLQGLKRLKEVPFVLEHGLNVSEAEILAERKLLESFLSKL